MQFVKDNHMQANQLLYENSKKRFEKVMSLVVSNTIWNEAILD